MATTDRVRIAAARLRITTDAKLGKETPQWVKDLAEEDPCPKATETAEVSGTTKRAHP